MQGGGDAGSGQAAAGRDEQVVEIHQLQVAARFPDLLPGPLVAPGLHLAAPAHLAAQVERPGGQVQPMHGGRLDRRRFDLQGVQPVLQGLPGAPLIHAEGNHSAGRHQLGRLPEVFHHVGRFAVRAGESKLLGRQDKAGAAALAAKDVLADWRQVAAGGGHDDGEIFLRHAGGSFGDGI